MKNYAGGQLSSQCSGIVRYERQCIRLVLGLVDKNYYKQFELNSPLKIPLARKGSYRVRRGGTPVTRNFLHGFRLTQDPLIFPFAFFSAVALCGGRLPISKICCKENFYALKVL